MRLDIHILGVSETHWTNGIEEAFEESKHVIFQSSRSDAIHRQGVAIVMSKEMAEYVIDYQLFSERIMSVTLGLADGPITLFQIYAPDTSYSEDEIIIFYESLQDRLDLISKRNKLIIMGDFNAKVGCNAHTVLPEVVGRFAVGYPNQSGENLLHFCAMNNLSIMNTFYQHKKCRLVTWTSPDGKSQNQIDYFLVKHADRSVFKNCRAYNCGYWFRRLTTVI